MLADYLTAFDNISLLTALVLMITAFVTALFTAAMGVGGGVLLLAVLASTVPVHALIPVHGLVQLGANGNRALMTVRHLDRAVFCYFLAGALAGAIVASFVIVQLPVIWIQLAVATFILFLVWGPKPDIRETSASGYVAAGGITTLISMFVGAAGPLVAAFIHRNYDDKLRLTATFAACMTVQHALKGVVFTFVGFAIYQWAFLILAMVISGTLGTWVGLKMLVRIPTGHFKRAFKWIVTLLALRLLYQVGCTLFY